MYGHLEFQQQLMAGIFARQPKAPPTSAEYFLSRLGKTKHFCDLKKEPYHFGEFGFQDEQAYLALEPAEYINSAGYDELLLLRTLWIPPGKRGEGVFSKTIATLLDTIHKNSCCSVLAVSHPFEYPPNINPFTDLFPPGISFDYSEDPAKAKHINYVLGKNGFVEMNSDKFAEIQGWDSLKTNNQEGKLFCWRNTRSTWLLNSFFRAIIPLGD